MGGFLLVIMFLVQPISFSSAQQDYCQISQRHTLCQFKGNGPKCQSITAQGVDDGLRQVILQVHNSLRSLIASGLETRGRPGPQLPASNMQFMAWDDELAAIAQRWADQCNFFHDCNDCRKVKRFAVGQNLGLETTTGPSRPANWKKIITKWYEEVETFPSTDITSYKFMNVAGHYTQLVWAETNRVGCGFTAYSVNNRRINYYVCNYGPAGNFAGKEVYKTGPGCSQCPTQSVCSTQFPNLCETAKKTGPSIKSPIANLLPKTSEATSFETPTFLSCQVGRNSCKAVFHGAPWNFKSDSQSTFPDYVETSVAVGQTAKLRLNQTLVTPDSNLLCLSIRMRHIIAIQPESVKSGALLQLIVPALSIHFRPTIGSSLVIPVETVADGRWILMQMTISGIQTPYDVIFQQDGPMTVSAVPVTIPAAVQLALEKLTLHNGNC